MNPAVHYFVAEKNPHHGEAIAHGFRARKVAASLRTLAVGTTHLIGGLGYGSLELLTQAMARGEPYVFFDRAYFGGGPGSNRLRVVPGAYQHHWQQAPQARDRLQALGVKLAPWRMQGSHILIVPPSAAICQLFALGDWLARTEQMVRAAFDGPVIVSRKGQGKPAAEHFGNCWAVVTYTSNVAVEAVCAGIPCFVDRKSAAAPVSLNLEQFAERCERPYLADNREAWASALAYGQYTIDEIESGLAAAYVAEQLRG